MSRAYRPSNGVWELIDDNEAGRVASVRAKARLEPMYQLQDFREAIHPRFNRQNNVVLPTSLQVKGVITVYTEKNKNIAEVLKNLKAPLTTNFDLQLHPALICFTNGVVDLTPGALQVRCG